jgi:cell division protein FtsI/penicillin-binding protein 2
VDVRTRQVVEQQWAGAEKPIPVGSLVKPFVALAFGGPFPEFECRGAANGCWLAKGHGRLGFREALAKSCNAYFLNLARGVDSESLAVVANRFGIPPPSRETPQARIGLGKDWKISPVALTRAYCELASRAGEPRIDDLLAGLRIAAESGTARALGRGVLAKTGTAPCVSEPRDAGDGFAMVLDPAEAPRIAILVQVHGAPGAEAAKSAGLILRKLRSGK